ncbi:hypothetical protein [Litchfieldia alkalitelluris]|uniref:hypothetical protein n=1 Tax=Litchfieldia alkalitelluris TaxID=304268 RepID=UPI0009972974|nr:hypothetical protein [Litchfieldia alkalitelluris]
MKREKKPGEITYSKYLNSPDSFRYNYEEWVNKNLFEDEDKCSRCGTELNDFSICPKCHF